MIMKLVLHLLEGLTLFINLGTGLACFLERIFLYLSQTTQLKSSNHSLPCSGPAEWHGMKMCLELDLGIGTGQEQHEHA